MTATDPREFLLASMRLAVLNLRTWQNELEFIGTGLRGGIMSMDAACEALDDIGLLHWLPPAAATYASDDAPKPGACETCGLAPCPNPSFCNACRKADQRKGARQ